jgi:hypothetical protein
MKMWIARGRMGMLQIFRFKPWINDDKSDWCHVGGCFPIDSQLIPEVTFENSPQEVEVKLKLIEK